MGRKPHKRVSRRTKQPSYSLATVQSLAARGRVRIRHNAHQDAYRAFGWTTDDILAAIKRLRRKDFNKTAPLESLPSIMVDTYKAYNLLGENVYTHFYIDPNGPSGKTLIINSFKEIR